MFSIYIVIPGIFSAICFQISKLKENENVASFVHLYCRDYDKDFLDFRFPTKTLLALERGAVTRY